MVVSLAYTAPSPGEVTAALAAGAADEQQPAGQRRDDRHADDRCQARTDPRVAVMPWRGFGTLLTSSKRMTSRCRALPLGWQVVRVSPLLTPSCPTTPNWSGDTTQGLPWPSKGLTAR